jgi:hypothetical protein
MTATYVMVPIAIAALVAFVVLYVRKDPPAPCPRCRTPLTPDEEARAIEPVSGTYLSQLVEAYRCTGCGGEYRQRNRGPIVSLETFDASGDFPEARIHRE